MISINYADLVAALPGTTVSKPTGALSGHAVGSLFEEPVLNLLKRTYLLPAYTQHEYLNKLYAGNPTALTLEQRQALINFEPARILLMRDPRPTKEWQPDKLFKAKQDDTADALVTDGYGYELIDIKTRQLQIGTKAGRGPNLISSAKLVKMSQKIKELYSSPFNAGSNTVLQPHFNLVYLGIDWVVDGKLIRCKKAYSRSLFKISPSKLKINWTAGRQLQNVVEKMPQDYNGNLEQWANEYLQHYIKSGKSYVNTLGKELADLEKNIA